MDGIFDSTLEANNWLANDKAKFMSSGDVTCTYCKCTILIGSIVYDEDYNITDFANSVGYLSKRILTQKHRNHAIAARKSGNNPITLHSYIPILVDTPVSEYNLQMFNLRALVNSSILLNK